MNTKDESCGMSYETAFEVIEVVDYDIAKDLQHEDPDEMLSMALQIKAIIESDS